MRFLEPEFYLEQKNQVHTKISENFILL